MMHKAWCRVEEVPYYFSRSSIKFQGHAGWKIDDLNPISARLLGGSQLSNPSGLPCFHDFGPFLVQPAAVFVILRWQFLYHDVIIIFSFFLPQVKTAPSITTENFETNGEFRRRHLTLKIYCSLFRFGAMCAIGFSAQSQQGGVLWNSL